MSEHPSWHPVRLTGPEGWDWRQELWGDWKVKCGDTTYTVHRVLLGQGPRASAFFQGAFEYATEEAATDLTELLPLESRGRVFEFALDFIYGKEVHFILPAAEGFDSSAWVALYKVADVLQCDSLTRFCERHMAAHEPDLNRLLLWRACSRALDLPDLTLRYTLYLFQVYGTDVFPTLRASFLDIWDVLISDELGIPEDEVAQLVLESLRAQLTPPDTWKSPWDLPVADSLWGTVRFAGITTEMLRILPNTAALQVALGNGLRARRLQVFDHQVPGAKPPRAMGFIKTECSGAVSLSPDASTAVCWGQSSRARATRVRDLLVEFRFSCASVICPFTLVVGFTPRELDLDRTSPLLARGESGKHNAHSGYAVDVTPFRKGPIGAQLRWFQHGQMAGTFSLSTPTFPPTIRLSYERLNRRIICQGEEDGLPFSIPLLVED